MGERDAPFIPSNIDPDERPTAAVCRTPPFERARSWDAFPFIFLAFGKHAKSEKQGCDVIVNNCVSHWITGTFHYCQASVVYIYCEWMT